MGVSTFPAGFERLNHCMYFSSKYVYAPKEQKEEYEYVPESVFNHAATKEDNDPSGDDGEVYTHSLTLSPLHVPFLSFLDVSSRHTRYCRPRGVHFNAG